MSVTLMVLLNEAVRLFESVAEHENTLMPTRTDTVVESELVKMATGDAMPVRKQRAETVGVWPVPLCLPLMSTVRETFTRAVALLWSVERLRISVVVMRELMPCPLLMIEPWKDGGGWQDPSATKTWPETQAWHLAQSMPLTV